MKYAVPAAAVLGVVGVFRDTVKWPAFAVAALAGSVTTIVLAFRVLSKLLC